MTDFRGRGFAQIICDTDERASVNKDLQGELIYFCNFNNET